MVSPDCIRRVVFAVHSAQPPRIDADLLGMMLLEMNRRALVARYGDNSVAAVEPFRYSALPHHPHLLVQVYKSLRCYLYQCSEGDVPDQPLYQQLVGVRDSMARALGHDGAETWRVPDIKAAYDACEWG